MTKRRQGALELEQMGLGDPEPGLAGSHRAGQIGGAHAGGESAQSAVRAGVGVGAQDHVAGPDQALLGQEGMLHAHPAHVVVVDDPVLLRELAHLLDQSGRLDVLVRREVVGDQRDPFGVEHMLEPGLFELVDGHAGGDVVAKAEIELEP